MNDIRSNENIVEGMVELLGGDFKQILTVRTERTSVDELIACLQASNL